MKSMEVAGFWLDKTEVTVAAYRVCEAAGVCTNPYPFDGCNAWGRDRHPMNCVGTSEAETYCNWVGVGPRVPRLRVDSYQHGNQRVSLREIHLEHRPSRW